MQVRISWTCFLTKSIVDDVPSIIGISLLALIRVMMVVDLLGSIILAMSGFAIGFIGGNYSRFIITKSIQVNHIPVCFAVQCSPELLMRQLLIL